MRDNGNLADFRIFGEHTQAFFERVARIAGAFVIMPIGEKAAPRRPGKENGHDLFRPGIMDELRKAEDRVLEMIIEPMHKHQHLLSRRRVHQPAEVGDRLWRLYSALSVTKSVAGSPGS